MVSWMGKGLLAGMLLGVAFYGAACWMGVPRIVLRQLEKNVRAQGLILRVDRIRPAWPGEFILERVALVSVADSNGCSVRSEKILVRLDWHDAVYGRVNVREVAIHDGDLVLPLRTQNENPVATSIRFRRLDVTIRKQADRLFIQASGVAFDRVRFRIEGTVELAGFGSLAGIDSLDIRLRKGLAMATPALTRIVRYNEQIDWGEEAAVEITFDVPSPVLVDSRVSLRAVGTNSIFFGQILERWKAEVNWKNGRVEPLMCRVETGGNRLDLQGWVDVGNRRLDLSCRGRWDSAHLLRMVRLWIPINDRLPADPILHGEAQVNLETGEGSWSNAAERISARIRLENKLELWGVPLTHLDIHIQKEGNGFRLDPVEVDIGREAGSGRVTGQIFYHLGTREFSGEMSGAADPVQILALLSPPETFFFGALRFLGEPPHLRGTFTGKMGDLSRLKVAGRVEGRDFVYQGTAVKEAEFDLSIDDETVRFSKLMVRRPEGELRGDVSLHLKDGRVAFDIDSRLQPDAMARILGPTVHRFVQQFRFEGATQISGSGWVQYRFPVCGDFQIEVDAERAGMEWAMAEHVAFTGIMKDRSLSFLQLHGSAYAGSLKGEAHLDWPAVHGVAPSYRVQGSIQDAELGGVLRDLTPERKDLYGGKLSIQLDLAGRIGTGMGPEASGTGSCKVQEGRLLSIPLFGGLSQFFSRIVSGYGYLSQTDLQSNFIIKNSRIQTENLTLSGPVMSMKARGDVGFDHSLQFIVQAQLLRSGPVASTFRILTSPLTKLLEFDLKGTLHAPEWKLKNMPNDFFLTPPKSLENPPHPPI